MPKSPLPRCFKCGRRIDRKCEIRRVTEARIWSRVISYCNSNGIEVTEDSVCCTSCHTAFAVNWDNGYEPSPLTTMNNNHENILVASQAQPSVETDNLSESSTSSTWTTRYGDNTTVCSTDSSTSSSSSSSTSSTWTSRYGDNTTLSSTDSSRSSSSGSSNSSTWTIRYGDNTTECSTDSSTSSSSSGSTMSSQTPNTSPLLSSLSSDLCSDVEDITGLDLYEYDDTRFHYNDVYHSSDTSTSSDESNSSEDSNTYAQTHQSLTVIPRNTFDSTQGSDVLVHDHHAVVHNQNEFNVLETGSRSNSPSPTMSSNDEASNIGSETTQHPNQNGLLSASGSDTSTDDENDDTASIYDFTNNTYKSFLPIKRANQSQSKCLVCGSRKGRSRVPSSIIQHVWIQKRIYISRKYCRICSFHIVNTQISEDTLSQIKSTDKGTFVPSDEFSKFLTDLSDRAGETRNAVVDFSETSTYTDEDFKLLLRVNKASFEDIVVKCKGKFRDSCNRSSRNAIAMLLLKFRLNISQNCIAWMFGIRGSNPQSTVSQTLSSVAKVLKSNFVPLHIGFRHKTREQFITEHRRVSREILCTTDTTTLIAAADGTYLYTQKPKDFALQKELFNPHKLRPLVKPMMVVLMDGYILSAGGVYKSDGGNNDAAILSQMMLCEDPEGILSLFQRGDHLVLDRGFTDCLDEVAYNRLVSMMPNLLPKNQHQFTADEGNQSRIVTMMRWTVEAVNGRVKNMFPFFASTIPLSYLPQLPVFFEIACAIINAYSPPIFVETAKSVNWAQEAIHRRFIDNELKTRVEEEGLKTKSVQMWTKADDTSVPTFPRLTLEEIQELTLGTYQTYLASLYTQAHAPQLYFEIMLHNEDESLVRARLKSRFVKNKIHDLWIQFEPLGVGEDAIIGWFCLCKVGSRTVGMCSHITCVIWYLGFARHNPQVLKKKKSLGVNLLDACRKRNMLNVLSDTDTVSNKSSSSETESEFEN